MISVVIPVYNEQGSLAILHEELARIAASANLRFEILFVDDGSTDGSWDLIRSLAEKHAIVVAVSPDPATQGHGQETVPQPVVHGIRFRRNFGKAAALSAGFAAARGDIIMTLDSDLQDDPAEIPRFLSKLHEGFDVISGWKQTRHDPWHKTWPSWVFNGMVSWVTGVKLHDHNCGMKCYRADVFREIRLYGELHRFIPVLAAARGFKVGEIAINHRPRQFGYSKYGMRRFVKGFLDLLTVKFLTGFGQRPQHLLGSIGLCSFVLGILGMIWLAGTWVWRLYDEKAFEPLHQRPALIYSAAAMLLGAQMMSIGFLAELITAYLGRDQESYSVKEKTTGARHSDSV